MPLFSVIIPVYNASSWIEECLQSILHQTFRDFEIVVIDDGSEDDSMDIVQHLSEVHHEVEWNIVQQENKGLGAARNHGVKICRGEWLAFLDADDTWSSSKLECVKDAIDRKPCLWIYHGVFEKDQQGLLRVRNTWSVRDMDHFISNGNPITPSATIIDKELFQKLHGFDENRDQVEDLGLWLRLFDEGITPLYLTENLTVYRLGSGVTSKLQDHLAKVENALRAAKEALIINEEQFQNFKERKDYETARFLHKEGAFKEALTLYKKNRSFKTSLLSLLAGMGIKA